MASNYLLSQAVGGRYAKERTYCIATAVDGWGPIPEVQLLDENKCASVEDAVTALNSGMVRSTDFCIVFSRRRQAFYLMWPFDKTEADVAKVTKAIQAARSRSQGYQVAPQPQPSPLKISSALQAYTTSINSSQSTTDCTPDSSNRDVAPASIPGDFDAWRSLGFTPSSPSRGLSSQSAMTNAAPVRKQSGDMTGQVTNASLSAAGLTPTNARKESGISLTTRPNSRKDSGDASVSGADTGISVTRRQSAADPERRETSPTRAYGVVGALPQGRMRRSSPTRATTPVRLTNSSSPEATEQPSRRSQLSRSVEPARRDLKGTPNKDGYEPLSHPILKRKDVSERTAKQLLKHGEHSAEVSSAMWLASSTGASSMPVGSSAAASSTSATVASSASGGSATTSSARKAPSTTAGEARPMTVCFANTTEMIVEDFIISENKFNPNDPTTRAALLEKLNFSEDAVIEAEQDNTGGFNNGVWNLSTNQTYGLALKLVESERRHPLIPTDTEKFIKLYTANPSLVNEFAFAFPVMIFRIRGAGDKRLEDLIVMRRASGRQLTQCLYHCFHANNAAELNRIFREFGIFMHTIHRVYKGLKHGDCQPSNVFYDSVNGYFTLIDVADMERVGTTRASDDVEHFATALRTLDVYYGASFCSEAEAQFKAGYSESRSRSSSKQASV